MTDKLFYGTGWRPDPPSDQDYHPQHQAIRELMDRTRVHKVTRAALPRSVDLRPWCSPVRFQGHYNTCTAHVVTGMLELLQTKAFGRCVEGSRLFLYQVTKRILGENGDPGVYLRQMMGAVVLLGVPPEKYWPYLDTTRTDDPRLDELPDAFCYAVADDFGVAHYFRLDPGEASKQQVLTQIRTHLAAGVPSSIGFPLYLSALKEARKSGRLPLAPADEPAVGSHAVLLVGYDDGMEIPSSEQGGEPTRGAFLLKNSWGTDWGEKGYGWLPYAYLTAGLAKDVWALMAPRWVETDQFQIGWDAPAPSAPPARG